jgi:hypothetical protein
LENRLFRWRTHFIRFWVASGYGGAVKSYPQATGIC